MELSSMLAGERFSDHPRSVDRSIAAFLRGYNDLVDDARRQDLYAYASHVVGTAGSGQVETLRARRLVEWGDETRRRQRRGWAVLRRFTVRPPRHGATPEAAARFAIGAARRLSDDIHAAVLVLIDELIAMGAPRLADDAPGLTSGGPRTRHELIEAG